MGVSSMKGYKPSEAQQSLLDDGDFIGYWKSVYVQSEGLIGRTELIGWEQYDFVGDVSLWEKAAAKLTWSNMEGALAEMGDGAPSIQDVGLALAKADIVARAADDLNTPHLLSPKQIAAYHFKTFEDMGLDRNLFGGTRYSGPGLWNMVGGRDVSTEAADNFYRYTWSPYSDVENDSADYLINGGHWAAGRGPREKFYGVDSVFSKEFASSNMAGNFESAIARKYNGNIPENAIMRNFDSNFDFEFATDLGNSASHLVGSYENGIAVREGDNVRFRVTNTMGRNSFAGGNWVNRLVGGNGWSNQSSPGQRRGPTQNIDMTIEWTTPLSELNNAYKP